MIVVIVGGGRTGAQLARILVNQGHDIRIVENRKEILAQLHKELPTESIIEGNPLEADVLEQAGIKQAQVMAATTTDDEINLALCYFVREQYNTNRTIARVNNPRDAWLFSNVFHVDVAVNQAELISSLIQEEMSLGDMMTLLKLRRGQYSLVEEKIPAGAPAVGTQIKDLGLPDSIVIAGIIRGGEMTLARGGTKFEVGDEVLAITNAEGAKKLATLFTPANH